MKNENKLLVIASAGGHLTQAMCATSLCDNIVLISNKKNISHKRISKIYKIWDTQYNPFIHLFNILFAVFILLKERPSAVFSTGGPIVLPFALICKLLPIKFIYLDTLSRVVELSNTGKLIKKYKLYNDFFCQWGEIAKQNNAQYIGQCFDIQCKPEYQAETKVPEGIPTILVTVGTNQYDFKRLFEQLYNLPLYNDKRVYWIIQAAHNKLTKLPANGRVVEMISRDEIEEIVKGASLVITHCGIGSINLMLSYQKRVFFVPRVARYKEFSDDHQLQIANEISSKIFTVVMPEQALLMPTFEELSSIPLLTGAVDTINYSMAKRMKKTFFSNY